MSAYRNPEYYQAPMPSYEVSEGVDITLRILEAEDFGEFTQEQFEALGGEMYPMATSDVCVGCGQTFPAEMLMYEGVEPIVYEPRCNICLIKQAQDIYGPEDVILPEEFRN